MDAILEPLTKSGKLVQYVRELNGFLQAEHVRRLAFRDWLPDGVKAEFINGEVVVHSPDRLSHTRARQRVSSLVRAHAMSRAIGEVLDEKAMVKFERNDYMPDVSFWRAEVARTFEPGQMFFPPPDWACEVLSPSTEHVDRSDKFDDYARDGVGEYWLVHPEEHYVEQYVLAGSQYELRGKFNSGTITSVRVPGFAVPVEAFFSDEQNLLALQAILAGR